jgi:hypothetical protein
MSSTEEGKRREREGGLIDEFNKLVSGAAEVDYGYGFKPYALGSTEVGISVADTRTESRLKRQCKENNIEFIEGQSNESLVERNQRLQDLQCAITNAKRRAHYNDAKETTNPIQREIKNAKRRAHYNDANETTKQKRQAGYDEVKDEKMRRDEKHITHDLENENNFLNVSSRNKDNLMLLSMIVLIHPMIRCQIYLVI